MMDRQLGHLVRLVDDLIDVSRITRDTIELRKAPVELASMHSPVRSRPARPLAEAPRRHQLDVTLPSEPIHVRGRRDPPGPGFQQPPEQQPASTPNPGGHIRLTAERVEG